MRKKMKRLILIALLFVCPGAAYCQQPAVETGVNVSAFSQHSTGHHQPTVGAFVQAIERRNNWAFIERVEFTNAKKLFAHSGYSIKLEGTVRYYIRQYIAEGQITHSFSTIDDLTKSATAFGLGAGYNYRDRAILSYAHRFADSTFNRTSANQLKVEFRENLPNDSRVYGKLKLGYSRVNFFQPFETVGKRVAHGADLEGGIGFRF
jgi:hypothetical protein